MSATILGPNVITGTKWPSMTSMWMTRAPASSTSPTCSRTRPKSADRIDGATSTVVGHSRIAATVIDGPLPPAGRPGASSSRRARPCRTRPCRRDEAASGGRREGRPRPRRAGSCTPSRRGGRRVRAASRAWASIRRWPSAILSADASSARQRASGRAARTPRPEQGGSSRMRSKLPSANSSASATTTRAHDAPNRSRVACSARARPAWRSTHTSSPRSAMSAASWPAFPPGAAHRSSTRMPGLGREQAGRQHRRPRLRPDDPRGQLGARRHVERPVDDDRLGQLGIAVRRARRDRRRRREGVFRRTDSSGGSFWATITASASASPSISSHSRTIQSGYECRSADRKRRRPSPPRRRRSGAARRLRGLRCGRPATRLQSSTVSFTAA